MAAVSTGNTTKERMIEVKNRLVESLATLNDIWDDIGLLEEQKKSRVDLAFMYIRNLIDEMVTEEEKRRKTLKDNIESYKEKLSTLCAELHVPPMSPTATRLYEIERELKQSVDCWEKEKMKRLEDLKELTGIEQAFCDAMYATPMYIPSGTVPSKEQLDNLRQHVDELATEKAKRYEKFTEQRDNITKILTDIGEEVTTEFEQDVVIEDPERFILSESNLAQLTVLNEKLQKKHAERIQAMATLQNKVEGLWNRLEISQEERNEVLNQIDDHTIASMNILEEELERCELLKLEHMQDFTAKVRAELKEWWEKCHYSTTQRNSFLPFNSDKYSEELLTQHEDALDAVKQFYRENEHLLKKIEKRTVLWNQMVAFDVKENDADRFRNRGGNLLVEERAKKKVLHQLPKVEEQLKEEVQEWENDNNKQFLIGGVQFFEYCRQQWEEYKNSKELQKQQRLEQKEKDMQSEIRFGSKPTPAKRRFCAGNTTPAAVQTPKQRKLNDTTRSATRLHSLSKIHSVFTSPATPSSSRTPLRASKTTSSLLRTPVSTRKPPVPRTPMSSMAPPRTPMSSMAPPRTPMSTRSTARKVNDLNRAKSCTTLASPNLKKSTKDPKPAMKRNERRGEQENTTPPSTSSEDIVSQSSHSTELEPVTSSYEEFENLLHSTKKSKQYRSTICPPK